MARFDGGRRADPGDHRFSRIINRLRALIHQDDVLETRDSHRLEKRHCRLAVAAPEIHACRQVFQTLSERCRERCERRRNNRALTLGQTRFRPSHLTVLAFAFAFAGTEP